MSPDAAAVPPVWPKEEAEAGQQNSGLPECWSWAALNDVAHVNPPTDFGELPADAEIPFIPMAAVAEESGQIDLSQRRAIEAVRKGYVRFREGDVIFAKITPCMENGKTAPVLGIPGGYAAGSTEFHVLRPRYVDVKFLWYWLVRRAFRQHAERNMSGSAGQLRVPVDYLRRALIPVAPVPEQRRIVARIEELFAEIAEGEAALERARRDLNTWRRALLKAAVTGELTRDWRDANHPTETAVTAITRIIANTSGSARDRAQKPSPLDASPLRPLPSGWAWSRLGRLGRVVSGQTPPGIAGLTEREGRYPWFKVSSMNDEANRDRMHKSSWYLSTASAKRLGLNILPVGTIIFPKRGGAILTNKKRRLEVDAGLDLNLMGFVPAPEFREFLWLYFLHLDLRKIYDGSNVPQINHDDVAEIVIAVPPPAEAREIAARAEELLFSADTEMTTIKGATADVTGLRQAVLKAAFEGRLVPQDPADEPASVMLARLRRQAAPSPTRRGGRRARPSPYPALPGLAGEPQQAPPFETPPRGGSSG